MNSNYFTELFMYRTYMFVWTVVTFFVVFCVFACSNIRSLARVISNTR